MYSMDFIKLSSKFGIIIFLVGIGLSLAGLLSRYIDGNLHNHSIILGGVVISALGYVILMLKNLVSDEI